MLGDPQFLATTATVYQPHTMLTQEISIRGLSRKAVLTALYNYKALKPLSDDHFEKYGTHYDDTDRHLYFNGKAFCIDFFNGHVMGTQGYDDSYGVGSARNVVEPSSRVHLVRYIIKGVISPLL